MSTTFEQFSHGRDKAIEISNTHWWERCDHRTIAFRQLFTRELICPFSVFNEAIEKSLGRPVWTHEFALNFDGIVREFLGEQPPPTMQDILEMIPEEKRIVVKGV